MPMVPLTHLCHKENALCKDLQYPVTHYRHMGTQHGLATMHEVPCLARFWMLYKTWRMPSKIQGNNILNLEELKNYKQIFLFDIGKHGKVIYKKFIAEHLAVKAFCSSYGDKKIFMEIPVLRPDEIPKNDDSLVVIASSCLQEISKILDEEGITNYINGVGYAIDSVILEGQTTFFLKTFHVSNKHARV